LGWIDVERVQKEKGPGLDSDGHKRLTTGTIKN
jgi:hypothetical protein